MIINITPRSTRNRQKIYYLVKWGKGPGERSATGIFIYTKPRDQLQRNHNKEALGTLETKRSQLTLETGRPGVHAWRLTALTRGQIPWLAPDTVNGYAQSPGPSPTPYTPPPRLPHHSFSARLREYPIPMYANCWLDPVDNPKPGDFPSGCPEARLMDVWRPRQTGIDMLSPDLYASEFDYRCQLYTRLGNPLFIPEMNSGDDGARNVFVAIGKYNAIGVSPFGIDHIRDAEKSGFSKSYGILGQLAPLLLEKEVRKEVTGFVIDEKNPTITCEMNGYKLEISLDELFGHKATLGYGLVMADGNNKFIGAGSGFRVRFFPSDKNSKDIVGVGNIDEGVFNEGTWLPGRRLNGDEDDQGRAWRFGSFQTSLEKCAVYTYK